VYLESALELGQVSPREVHSELLLIYLHMALEEEREGEARWVLEILAKCSGYILDSSQNILKVSVLLWGIAL
jgi:hypothetical protein